MRAALLLLLAACGEPPPPLPSELPPEQRGAAVTASAPASATAGTPGAGSPAAPETSASGRLWTPEDIDQLVPVAPAQQRRSPRPLPESAELLATLATLSKVVDQEALDASNPWAVAHAILARGAGTTLVDGRSAIDALFLDNAEIVTLGGHTLLQFPPERGEALIDPHTALQLKNMAEVGVAPDRAVSVGGQTRTVADLYRASVVSTFLDVKANKASFRSSDDVGWLVQALATWAPPGGLRWRSTAGSEQDLALLTRFSVGALVKETQFLAEAMKAGATFERKGQGIFRYTCGGAHLLQGAAYAVARGHGGEAERAAIRAQATLHLWRFPREQAITDAAIQKAPEHRLRLLSQRLKFAGHALESAQKLAILGFLDLDDAEQAVVAEMARSIATTTTALQEGGAFGKLDEIKAKDQQLYLDLVGDASHAIRGLELALGRQTLAW